MKSIRDVMAGMVSRHDNDTPKQRQLIAESVEVAMAWYRGELPLNAAKELTGDGWLRNQVSRRMIGDTEEAVAWRSFIVEIDAENNANCENGGFYELQSGKRIWLSKLQIVSLNGKVESVFDPETGEEVCVSVFPRVNLAAPPKREQGNPTASPMMAEWYE